MGMEEIYNDHQSSLVWTSMHDLASWSEEDGDQPKTTQKELFNDLKAGCQSLGTHCGIMH